MKTLILVIALTTSALALPPQHPEPPRQHPERQKPKPPELPKGCVEYTPAGYTQRIAVTSGRDTIIPIKIDTLEAKWEVSGGMVGVRGWKSRKFRLIPEGRRVRAWIGNIAVWNGSNYQDNRGLKRHYPIGTEFHDVLYNADGEVFEHRRALKDEEGDWMREVIYRNPDAYPKGYTGLKVSCASCHSQAGTGGYATGLVPGGDGVISDPLDWTLLGADEGKVPVSMAQPVIVEERAFPTFRSSGACST